MVSAKDRGAPRPLGLLCAIIFLLCSTGMFVEAQTLASTSKVAVPPVVANAADAEADRVDLLVGRSAVLNVGAAIARVSLTRPEIADAVPTSSQQLLIHGKAPGSISMFVWDRAGGIRRYEVSVRRDLVELTKQIQQLFPGEPIQVLDNGKDLVLSGAVSSKYVLEKALDVAAGYVEKKDNVVNLLQMRESARSNQVLLRVRFAEVSRTAMTELGASFFTGAGGYKDYLGRATTQQFPAPYFDSKDGSPSLIFSDFLNLFLFNSKEGLGVVIRAMQNKGLFQSLAEPNLIAENGKEASFLAGGEYPYPAVQGSGATLAVTIVFKEFGIRLNFTPTILGDEQIRLKVRPEVSSLDFSNAVSYQGFRIPSLTTRRAETEVELQNGQTFAIAGLLNNTMTSSLQKIPGIGDIPILGLLFRSKAAQKSQSELVVMITPEILPRASKGVNDRLPGLIEPYLPPVGKTVPPPPPYPGQLPRAPQEAASTAPAVGQTPAQGRPALAATGSTASAAPGAPASAPAAPSVPVVAAPPSAAVVPVPAPAPAVAAPPAAPAGGGAAAQPAATVQPDKKTLEREQKEIQKRLDAEAQQQRKQEAEEQRAKEAAAKRAAEEAARQQKVAAEEAARQQKIAAEETRRAEELAQQRRAKAEQQRKQQEKLAREQAKRDAEAARKQAEVDRKRAEEMREVEDRLKEAQAAYEVAVQKAKQK